MKAIKAVVQEQTLTFAVSLDDLKALLPAKVRKMVDGGAKFEANVSYTEEEPVPFADCTLVLSVFQRSAPRTAEIGK